MTAIAGHPEGAAVTAHNSIFINGEWVASSGRESIAVVNPATENTIA